MVTVVNYRFIPCNAKVSRPSIFGNPFSHHPCGWGCASQNKHVTHVPTREEAVLRFIEYWYADEQRWLRDMAFRTFSKDAVLGCVCNPKPCHADIIAGYLNWRNHA
jgi:uncharacterized protein DUF4326